MPDKTFKITVSKGHGESFGITLLGDGPSVVSEVTSGSPAALAGVKAGFVVVEIDEKNVIYKDHLEVRDVLEPLRKANFKFSTLDYACALFGDQLKILYESSRSKKRRSSGEHAKKSPRKTDENQPDLIIRTKREF